MIQSEFTLKNLDTTNLDKIIGKVSELSPNLSNKQHFFAQLYFDFALQNVRHKRVNYQCKIIELTPYSCLIK